MSTRLIKIAAVCLDFVQLIPSPMQKKWRLHHRDMIFCPPAAHDFNYFIIWYTQAGGSDSRGTGRN